MASLVQLTHTQAHQPDGVTRRVLAQGLALGATLRPGVRVGAVLGSALGGSVQAQVARTLVPTPSQTEGPFYPAETLKDEDADLLRYGDQVYAKGTPVTLTGEVRDVRGVPIPDAVVEIWQCDEGGHYRHPRGGPVDAAFQGFGRVAVDAQGRYTFRTIRPSPYVGRTPHIHVKVRRGSREMLTTQLYVAGLASNERDGLYRRLDAEERAALTVPFEPDGSGMQRAHFGIVVRG